LLQQVQDISIVKLDGLRPITATSGVTRTCD
jgi:hypothetical protein